MGGGFQNHPSKMVFLPASSRRYPVPKGCAFSLLIAQKHLETFSQGLPLDGWMEKTIGKQGKTTTMFVKPWFSSVLLESCFMFFELAANQRPLLGNCKWLKGVSGSVNCDALHRRLSQKELQQKVIFESTTRSTRLWVKGTKKKLYYW